MRLLFTLLLSVIAAATCPCCEDGQLIHVDDRCNIRHNQAVPRWNLKGPHCQGVTASTAALEEQLAILQAEITTIVDEITAAEAAGDVITVAALEDELAIVESQDVALGFGLRAVEGTC